MTLATRLLDRLTAMGLSGWRLVLVGFWRRLFSKEDVEGFATGVVEVVDDVSPELAILANASRESDDDVLAALRTVAEVEGEEIERMDDYAEQCDRLRLGQLLVAWEKLPHDESLLKQVAQIYADFGYPEDMRPCVYYMPPDGVNSSRVELGEKLESPIEALKRLLAELSERLGARNAKT